MAGRLRASSVRARRTCAVRMTIFAIIRECHERCTLTQTICVPATKLRCSEILI
jgi:hypothetical protein